MGTRFDLAEKMHPESLVEDRKEPKLVLTRHFQAHIMEMSLKPPRKSSELVVAGYAGDKAKGGRVFGTYNHLNYSPEVLNGKPRPPL